MRPATVRGAVKVAMSGNRAWHLLDAKGETYCGGMVPRLLGCRDFASLAAAREAEAETRGGQPRKVGDGGGVLCQGCIDNRRMRGDA